MSSDNTNSTPTSPSEAEIIDFTANTSISVSFWETEIIDLTKDDTPELPHDDSISATLLEPNSNRMMFYTEPVSYEEDEASVKSERWSLAEVDYGYAMGYFAPDPMEDDESVTELTPSEYTTAIRCFEPAPAENDPSMGLESSCSPTEIDFDFAMGYFGAEAELDKDNSDETECMPELEYDSILGYCGPDRKMMRRAQSCLRQEGKIIDLKADLKQE